jgi:hypothetical protein
MKLPIETLIAYSCSIPAFFGEIIIFFKKSAKKFCMWRNDIIFVAHKGKILF